jgi:CBS domain-containing protein
MKITTMKAVMTPFPYSIAMGDSAILAEEMMSSHGIHHLPVKSAETIVGVVSAAGVRGAPEGATVADLMQVDPHVVELGTSLEDVLFHMADHHLECVVVTKDSRLAGIFTSSDVCRAYGKDLHRRRTDGHDAA